ncbi:transcriptional repressor [Acidimicrobiia bacterium EGI L10123]|uniref:Fur family transcriptional regulator n=1 Tax=Salinilacustrithrix flava TaxID=2957203 RepID=UPI003D7C2659|nr:transcriptional repressor [Acidimicrobiia bacterium EGI L10123]
MTAELHDIASARLRTTGQRYTTRRRALVEVLDQADGPLTIPQILELDRSLAQSSAYRNLAVLEQADVVHRIVTNDDFARYELAEDLTEHHHHLICRTCGSVADFTLDPSVEGDLDRVLADVADAQSFQADHHRLDLVGTCADCR